MVNLNTKKLPTEDTTILIKPGMVFSEITDELYNNKIITNKLLFSSWVKINFISKNLKAGEYKIKKNSSILDVITQLKKGTSIIRYFQILEGSTHYKLRNDLIQLFKSKKEKIDIPKNLIADTYGYNYNDDIEEIISNIDSYSKRKSMNIWNSRNKDIPLKTVNELFIIASIIEKETSKNSEKQIIAGVFYNRIQSNMKLQSDPTVIYSISQGKEFTRALTRKDTKFKSDYNTYYVRGLPPSPICFPSLSSLYAAANPKKTNYYYFVADRKGGHLFSKDYATHRKKIKMIKKNAN